MPNPEPQAFSVHSLTSAGALIVEVAGEIDMTTAPELSRAIDQVPDGTTHVVVDLSEVSFLDSSGLNALVQARRVLEDRQASMRVVVPPEGAIRRVFEITHLTDPLTVVDTRQSALP